VTGQDLFTLAMKEAFAPALRSAGLRGSSPSFSIPSMTHFALLGFQKSQSSHADDVKFTFNLKVVSKDAWHGMRATHPYFPAKPAPNTRYGTFEWNKRIGDLLPGGEDTWWHLRVDQDNAPTIANVVDVLMSIAAPALRRQLEVTIG
jgi:Domain of unknown function (DUF4304)